VYTARIIAWQQRPWAAVLPGAEKLARLLI
jgi:hypothetical protein